MKFTVVAALGLLTFASSQSLSGLPQCAESCAISAVGSTGCAVTNATCICEATSFLQGVDSCIQTACSAADIQATLQFAQKYCLSGGVTITLPTQAATSVAPVSEASEGQPRVTSVAPVSEASEGQPRVTTQASGVPVSEASEGQPRVTSVASGAPVSEASEGQPRVTSVASGAPVSEASEGQPRVTSVASGAPVSEASEGQPRVTSVAPVSEASEGQPQVTSVAPASSVAPVSEASEGQPQATTAAPATFTGAAATIGTNMVGALVGLGVGVVGML